MEKKVTKEEFERVLNKLKYTKAVKEEILNELFPPEFRIGEYSKNTAGHVDKIAAISMKRNNPIVEYEDGTWDFLHDIRHATPEEISVHEFIKKLRMSEEEARELEDDRVEMSKEELFWSVKSSEKMTINSRQSEKGVYVIMETDVAFCRINEDGRVEMHLTKRTASELSNIIAKTLIEGNPKED